MSKLTYHGYEIEHSVDTDNWWRISKDGEVLNVQASEDAARQWIDAERKKGITQWSQSQFSRVSQL